MQSTEAKPGTSSSSTGPNVPDSPLAGVKQHHVPSTVRAAPHSDGVTQVAGVTVLTADRSKSQGQGPMSHAATPTPDTLSASSYVHAPPLALLPPSTQVAEVTNSHDLTQMLHVVPPAASKPLASHSSPATDFGVAITSLILTLPPKQPSSGATGKASPTSDLALDGPLLPPPKPKQASPAAIDKVSPAPVSALLSSLAPPVPSVTRLLDSISSTAPDVTHVDRAVSLSSKFKASTTSRSTGSSTLLSALLSIPESSSISDIGLANVIGSPVISAVRHKKAAESADAPKRGSQPPDASPRQPVPEHPRAADLTDDVRSSAADLKARKSSKIREARSREAGQAHILQQWEARAQQLFVSVSEAARRSGLTRGVVDGWVSANLVKHLKTGDRNAMRLCDVSDVLRLRDQRLAPSMPRSLEPDSRSLLYTRLGPSERPGWGEEDLSDEVERLSEELSLQLAQTHPALADWEPLKCTEIAESSDLDRPGFVRIMALILGREINNLIVTDAEQLCPCEPLLAWLCMQNHVTLVQIRPNGTALQS